MDFTAVVEYAKQVAPDVVVIGPDDPIGKGLTDKLQAADFAVFAPMAACAQLESSKAFTRQLLNENGLMRYNPGYAVITDTNELQPFYDT